VQIDSHREARFGSKTDPLFDARISASASYGHAAAWALFCHVPLAD